MNKVKFSVFADIHHEPNAFMTNAYSKVALIQKKADNVKSDFIIHVGDLTHGPSSVKGDAPNFVKFYNAFHIPSYHCLGNHDSDNTSFEETLKGYAMPSDYYHFDVNGYRFIVLNPNYYQDGGKDIPYSLGNYYTTTGSVGYMPQTQLQWLEQSIMEFDGSCILFSHQSFERPDGVSNRQQVTDLLDKCNQLRTSAVIMCINGHMHTDYIREINDILYFDLNSCGGPYIGKPHHHYPLRLRTKYSCINNTLVINEPIHAVITISDDGEINIEGMNGSFFMNVTIDMTKNSTLDEAGRAYSADVSSYKGNYKIKE